MDRRRIGTDAENRAAEYLRAAGLIILRRNYHCRLGELDIVARHDALLVIAEVRCRAREDFGGAAASVTAAKQRRIILATRHLLMCNPSLARLAIRFDVLAVGADLRHIDWLRGAFGEA